MNTENKNNGKDNKDSIKKKEWKKPIIFTVTQEELRKHIRAAARSGTCISSVAR